jgi:hypothetical protein
MLLSYVPDYEAARAGVWISDFDLARSIFDVELPDSTDRDAIVSYVTELNRLADAERGDFLFKGLYLTGFGDTRQAIEARAAMREHVGFAQAEIKQSVMFTDSSNPREIIFGNIDPTLTRDLVMGCEVCPVAHVQSTGEVDTISWETESISNLTLRFAPPLFDSGGVGGYLSVSDGIAWRTRDNDGTEQLISTAASPGSSLASSDNYVEFVRTMLDAGVYSMFVSGKTVGKEDPIRFAESVILDTGYGLTQEQWNRLAAAVLLSRFPDKYGLYAVASGVDGNGPYSAIVYKYDTLAEAQDNADRLAELVKSGVATFSFFRDIDGWSAGVEATTIGNTVWVTWRNISLGLSAVSLLNDSVPIFVHE